MLRSSVFGRLNSFQKTVDGKKYSLKIFPASGEVGFFFGAETLLGVLTKVHQPLQTHFCHPAPFLFAQRSFYFAQFHFSSTHPANDVHDS